MNRKFRSMLEARWAEDKFVCVGLDSEWGRIPECIKGFHRNEVFVITSFNRAIVEATKDLVCAYKPNVAFYEAYGAEGITALQRTIADIHAIAPDVPVILDAKRADIGNTNAGSVKFAFDCLRADAITVHPYLGQEALQPFLDCKDKGIFVLCLTSNPGANEFQSWDISGDVVPGGYMPLYKYVAYRVSSKWDKYGNCAIVAGATHPEELREVRAVVGNMPILIPGIGAQGGDVEETVRAGMDGRKQGVIINSSRSIIFASKDRDFAEAARRETEKLHNLINQYRNN